MNKYLVATVAALSLVGASCRKNEHGLYPVAGKVLYKGTPAAGAAVFFYRKDKDAHPLREQMVMGVVRDDGAFELVCGPWGKGAPPGCYDVIVEWRPVVGQRNGNPLRASDKLNGRYGDLHHPALQAVVESRPNLLPPFELTD